MALSLYVYACSPHKCTCTLCMYDSEEVLESLELESQIVMRHLLWKNSPALLVAKPFSSLSDSFFFNPIFLEAHGTWGRGEKKNLMLLSYMCRSTSGFIFSKTVILVVAGRGCLKTYLIKQNKTILDWRRINLGGLILFH